MAETSPTIAYKYKAFISYSHASDGKLASAIEVGLERFARPWYRPRPFDVFRDETGLALTPSLWGDIKRRLEQSEYFVLLASPEAAQSRWVQQEIEFWLTHRSPEKLVIVLTGGKLRWAGDDFDWSTTDALPRGLSKAFKEQPLWADLSWAKGRSQLSLRHQTFALTIARIVAVFRGQSLEAVMDEEVERHRSQMRLIYAALAASLVLAAVALGSAVLSFQAKRSAQRVADLQKTENEKLEAAAKKARQDEIRKVEQQRNDAMSAKVAATAASVLDDDRELSMLLALEAVTIAPTPQAEDALRQTLVQLIQPTVLQGHSGHVWTARFSSDGNLLVTGSDDGTVRLWETATGKNLQTFAVTDPKRGDWADGMLGGDPRTIVALTLPDTLKVGNWNGAPSVVYDATTGKRLLTLDDDDTTCADLSADGKLIVTGGFGTRVQVWDAHSGRKQFESSADTAGHHDRVTCAQFRRDGKAFLSASWDGTVRICDAATGQLRATLRVSDNGVDTAAFLGDGQRIVTIDHDGGDMRVWDWNKTPGSSLVQFVGHSKRIITVAYDSEGKRLVTSSLDRTARVWDADTGRCLHVLTGHEEPIRGLDVSPNGKWIVTADSDRKANIWDLATGQQLMRLGRSEFGRTCATFAPDGTRLVVGTTKGEVQLYTCPILGPLDDLVTLARARVGDRSLTPDERQKYLNR